MEQFFLKEGIGKKKKKDKEPKSNPPEQVYALGVVAISETKEEKDEEGFLPWSPKLKNVGVNFNSNPKLLECVISLEIACKNLFNICGEIKKNPQCAMHHGIYLG